MPKEALRHPRVIICEGYDEQAIVWELIKKNLIPEVSTSLIGDSGNGRGINGLRKHLISLVTDPNFKRVSDIAIFCDSDDCQTTTFSYVANEVSEANNHPDVKGVYAVPTGPFIKAPVLRP